MLLKVLEFVGCFIDCMSHYKTHINALTALFAIVLAIHSDHLEISFFSYHKLNNMHLSSWINILCLVAVLNARAVRRKRQSVELSDKILDGKRSMLYIPN